MSFETNISMIIRKISLDIRDIAKKKEKTLAVAESCTSGLLGSFLTDVPGSSHYFWGGVISYHNECKKKLLKVCSKTLDRYGAVSCQTAQEMSRGLFLLSHADLCVSLTGIAGPQGGSLEKKIGTLWVSLFYQNSFYNRSFHCSQTRVNIKKLFCLKVLFFIKNQYKSII